MLMLPEEEGSEEKEKKFWGKKTKKILVLFFLNWITAGSHPDVVTWEEFFNDTFVLPEKPDCIYAFLIPSNICEYFTHTYC